MDVGKVKLVILVGMGRLFDVRAKGFQGDGLVGKWEGK